VGGTLEFTLLIAAGSFLAGLLGSLTGLGGGVIIVPLLALVFGVDIRYAIGASLVSVIATSSGAAAAYLKEGFSNIRVGMFLEVATTIGAVCGAYLTARVPTAAIAIIFGMVLLYSAWVSINPVGEVPIPEQPGPVARVLRLDGSYPTPEGTVAYHVTGVPLGFSLMYVAGVLSGLLGIGSGAVKVLAMDRAMKIPFKVSTTTSNFMIGVTAAASAIVYYRRGDILVQYAAPLAVGVFMGSLLGARMAPRIHTKVVVYLLVAVMLYLAGHLIFHLLGVSL
jgi:uncharacterized membrane protein YfcA